LQVVNVRDDLPRVRNTLESGHQRITELLLSFDKPYYRLAQKVTELQQKLDEKTQRKLNRRIYRWLSPSNFRDHHATASEDLLSASAFWFVNNTKFQDWEISSESNIL
jgi:hypothetical protein